MNKGYMITACICAALVLASGCSTEDSSLMSYESPKTAWDAAADKTDAPAGSQPVSTAVTKAPETTESRTAAVTTAGVILSGNTAPLSSPEDIDLHDTDGGGTNYVFTYGKEEYEAIYTPDNWKIVNSYRIKRLQDLKIICSALISIHPIPDKDRIGYRTADDLAYEWSEHNSAYEMLPDDSPWKANVRDVDLDPDDQGKSMVDMALDRLQ